MIIDQCRKLALRAPARVVFPDALDVRVLKAAHYLQQQGLAHPILVASPFALRQFALGERLPLTGVQVIDPHSNLAMREAFAAAWQARAGDKAPADAVDKLADPLMFAAAMVSAGQAEVCIAGNLSSTASVLRAGLRLIGLQPGCKTLSSLFLMLPQYTGQPLGEMTEHSELRPRLPLIAVPTTAGTGSETTNVTVIIDAVSGRKQVLAHASLMPDVAILDAALTEGVPPHITAMTGIDALTHAVEAYSARHATPFTDSLAMGAIVMIGEALPKAVGCGQDLAARENMLLASCMAGMAFSSAGLGLCHAMAHQPGAALHIPHGLANAMLLPTVMEFNRMVRRARFSQIGRALTGKKTDDREAIAAVRELIAEVGLTMRLTEAGATSAHYAAWAQAAQEDICLRTNPRTASREQIIELYAAAQ